MNFQKPENALRRAEELIGVGQPESALQVLHHTISHRKFRVQGWDIIQEHILMMYVGLCVDLNKLLVAREGLHQYRQVAQAQNAASLGKVLKELRDRAEAKLAEAKKQMEEDQTEQQEVQRAIADDLDIEESPESLLLSMLQIEIRDQKTKNVNAALRMCWECYKMILDILRMTAKQEKVYHETAQRALEFCYVNQRPQEFKRLCDLLRSHYLLLLKNKAKLTDDGLLRPENHFETRLEQLKVAAKLELWRESYQTAEDIFNLGIHEQLNLHKASVTGTSRAKLLGAVATYYEKLSQIFWVSEHFLFHAQAWMKFLLHNKMYRRQQTPEQLGSMASIAVLAVMAVPLLTPSDIAKQTTLQYEHQRKLSLLLGHPNVPSREGLKNVLQARGILAMGCPEVQQLFSLVERDDVAAPKLYNDDVRTLFKFCEEDENLKNYVLPVKRVIFHKILIQLSKVYSSIGIEYFVQHICPEDFLPWGQAEIEIVSLVHSKRLQLRLDYAQNALFFGGSSIDPDGVIRERLATFMQQMEKCVSVLDGPVRERELLDDRNQFYRDIQSKLKAEHSRLQNRSRGVQQRRTEQLEEQRRQVAARRRQEKEKADREEQQELQRRVDAQKQRELRQRKEELTKEKIAAAEAIVEEIKKISVAASKVSLKGKGAEEIRLKDLPLSSFDVKRLLSGDVQLEDVEKAQEELRCRERQEKMYIRKQQAKKIDHYLRAILEEEKQLLPEWEDIVDTEDLKFLEECRKQKEEAIQVEKQCFVTFIPAIQEYVERHMLKRREQHEKKREEQVARLTKLLKKRKIDRAIDRKELKELEIRRREEERLRQEREQEEREREQREREKAAAEERERLEKQKKLDEQVEKQRQRDLEIEEKQRKAREARGGDFDFRRPTASPPASTGSPAPAPAAAAAPLDDRNRRGGAASTTSGGFGSRPSRWRNEDGDMDMMDWRRK